MKISIIIPSFNIVKLGLEPIDKVKEFIKDEESVEVIYINDGSSDGTVEFLEKEWENDKRFSVWSQENQGLAATRVNGLQKISGDSTHVIFLDADDNVDGDIKELLDYSNSNDVIFAFRSTVNRKEGNFEYTGLQRFTKSLFERFIFSNAIHGYAFPKRILMSGLTKKKITFEDVLYVKWAKGVDVKYPEIKIVNCSNIKKVINVLDTSLSRETDLTSPAARKKINDLVYVWTNMWKSLEELEANNNQLRYLFIGKFILEYFHISESIDKQTIKKAYEIIPKINNGYKQKVRISWKWKMFTFILRLRINTLSKLLVDHFMG